LKEQCINNLIELLLLHFTSLHCSHLSSVFVSHSQRHFTSLFRFLNFTFSFSYQSWPDPNNAIVESAKGTGVLGSLKFATLYCNSLPLPNNSVITSHHIIASLLFFIKEYHVSNVTHAFELFSLLRVL